MIIVIIASCIYFGIFVYVIFYNFDNYELVKT